MKERISFSQGVKKIPKEEVGKTQKDYELEERVREKIVSSFFISEKFVIDQEIEDTDKDPDWGEGADCSESWDRFMEDILKKVSKNKELIDQIKESSKNRVMIDLGCGLHQEFAVEIANGFGCSAYLGVDKHNVGRHVIQKEDGKKYRRVTEEITLYDNINSKIPAVLIREDMLEALKKLKDNSSVLLFNGIEWELFRLMPEDKRRKYFSDIAQEIRRVVGENGYILSSQTEMLNYGGLELKKDQEFQKNCNPNRINAIAELYRINS